MQLQYKPVMDRAEHVDFDLTGEVGQRLSAVTEQWIIPAPESNPAMLEMFRQRDVFPYRNLLLWSGEFAGKYLTHSVQILRLTGDEHLRKHLRQFVEELITCQADDGYLGCWPKSYRLTNHAPNVSWGTLNWDTWGHYHAMLGLLLWHELENDASALQAAIRIGDLICNLYLGKRTPRLVDTGNSEMNLAPAHSLCLLFRVTGTARYLEMAEQIVCEFGVRDSNGNYLAGNYLDAPLSGQEFFQMPKPRWESLHPIMSMAELYHITGKEEYRRAFVTIWRSIQRGDRHNNGGFSSGELATGNPYDKGAIETCCTVAWMAMTVEMLRLSGDATVADELEMSLLNSGMGLISENGRWVTYNTPMDGVREASAHTIVFQSRAGSPELNCCSVNGPRVLGLLSEWAFMQDDSGLILNYYGSGAISAVLPSGNRVNITQQTEYPYDNTVIIFLAQEQEEEFTLSLRIPAWSRNSRVLIAGKNVLVPQPGSYLRLPHCGTEIKEIRLELDFTLQFWRHPSPVYTGRLEPLKPSWQIIGYLSDHDWDNVTDWGRICAAAIPFNAPDGRIEFNSCTPLDGNAKTAYCFTEIECFHDSILPIAFSCHAEYACIVNGKIVSEGFEGVPYTCGHVVELPLKAGRNLIALRITSHDFFLIVSAGPLVIDSKPDYASIYRGPLLLAYDIRFNPERDNVTDVPILTMPTLKVEKCLGKTLFSGKDIAGKTFRYCTFADAGATGNYYQSWVPVGFPCRPAEFSETNPRRSFSVV